MYETIVENSRSLCGKFTLCSGWASIQWLQIEILDLTTLCALILLDLNRLINKLTSRDSWVRALILLDLNRLIKQLTSRDSWVSCCIHEINHNRYDVLSVCVCTHTHILAYILCDARVTFSICYLIIFISILLYIYLLLF